MVEIYRGDTVDIAIEATDSGGNALIAPSATAVVRIGIEDRPAKYEQAAAISSDRKSVTHTVPHSATLQLSGTFTLSVTVTEPAGPSDTEPRVWTAFETALKINGTVLSKGG